MPAPRPARPGRSPPSRAGPRMRRRTVRPLIRAGRREQPAARRQPRHPVRHKARTAIFRRLAGDHLGVATVELAGTQRPPRRRRRRDQRAVEVQQHRANWRHATSTAADADPQAPRPSCLPPPELRAASGITPGPARPGSRRQPRSSMAHLRWQKPANGSDMVAIAQIRWQRTPSLVSITSPNVVSPVVSFLILIGRFVTLDAWLVQASHPCTIR